MTKRKVRVGFVGSGGMGQCAHLRNYAVLDDCELAAIAELRDDVREGVAARYGVKKTYKDHAEMLASEELDGIVASQPFTRHGVLVPELLGAGVPVFTEKPLAGSVEVGERIVEAVRKSGTWHMVGYHKRSDPATELAGREIERLKGTGELGRLRYVRITMPPGDWVAGGFAGLVTGEGGAGLEHDPPASDMDEETYRQYVAFVNYYIHQVNLMRYLLGEAYEVAYADRAGVLLVARSEGGVTGAIEMAPYNTTRDWQESALVCFEKGYVKLVLPAPLVVNLAGRVEIFRDPGEGAEGQVPSEARPALTGVAGPEIVTPVLPPVAAMRRQAENFLACLRGERRPPCEAEEALEDLKVAREYIRLCTGK